MKTFKVILATLVIFCAGAIAGMMVTKERQAETAPGSANVSGDKKEDRRPGNRFEEEHDRRRQEFMGRLQQELNLSEQQYAQIESILDDSDKRIHAIYKPVKEQMRQEFQRVREQISAALSPDQQNIYQEMMKKHRSSKEQKDGETAPDESKDGDPTNSCSTFNNPEWQLWSQLSPNAGSCQLKEM